jgi:hypothetical protein
VLIPNNLNRSASRWLHCADINAACQDDSYPEFKMFMAELILDSCKYLPVA